MADFNFDDEEEDDNDDQNKEYLELKQFSVWLIDARSPMLAEAGVTDQGFEQTDTWFSIAIKIVKAHLKSCIISSSADQAAVILYGTGEKSEDSQFQHVYILQELDEGNARRLRDLDQLLGGRFSADIGSAKDGSTVEDLSVGLWAAFHQLARAPSNSQKKVYIMTNDPGPADDEAEHDRQRAISKGTELKDAGAMLELLPMVSADKEYRPSAFWAQLLELDADTVVNANAEDGSNASGLQLQRGQLSAWAEVTRFKTFKKRTLRMTNLTLGGFSIGVQLYKMVAKARKGKTFQLHAVTNDELITESALIDQDTGHVLTKPMLNKVVFPKEPKSRFPRVFFSREEMDELKKLGPPGIHVLGFKPIDRLKPHHNLREPTFIYPTDRSLQGSTTAFIALHDAMLQEQCFAVACAVYGRTDPALVALLPQEELIAEEMITLPYSDDIRLPEREAGFTGTDHIFANDGQIAAAENLIDALQLPEEFDSAAISNPTLQRFYEVLESRALAEDTPPVPPDQTLPDMKRFAAASDVMQAFVDATFVEGLDAKPKRKAESHPQAVDVAEIDWAGLAAAGQLMQKTAIELKAFCDVHKLKKTGAKAVLVERVEQHLKDG